METSKCPKCGSEPRRDAISPSAANPRRFLCGSYYLEDVAGVDDLSQSPLCAYRELPMLRAELARLKSEKEAAERELAYVSLAIGASESDDIDAVLEMRHQEFLGVEKQLTAATSRAEALENGIRTFLTQYEELRSHGYIASISHLPANCKWSEATKKERAIWGGLAALLPQAKEVDGAT